MKQNCIHNSNEFGTFDNVTGVCWVCGKTQKQISGYKKYPYGTVMKDGVLRAATVGEWQLSPKRDAAPFTAADLRDWIAKRRFDKDAAGCDDIKEDRYSLRDEGRNPDGSGESYAERNA